MLYIKHLNENWIGKHVGNMLKCSTQLKTAFDARQFKRD
jgi:hypothetical protein